MTRKTRLVAFTMMIIMSAAYAKKPIAFTLAEAATIVNPADPYATLTQAPPDACVNVSFRHPPGSPVFTGEPYSLAVGDFNLDRNLDIAAANWRYNTVTILLGDGSGIFKDPPGSLPIPVGTNPLFITAKDFNSDRKLDLAVVSSSSEDVTILLGKGDGQFVPGGPPVAVGKGPSSLAIIDFNSDGKDDLAVVNTDSNNITLLRGDGSGRFIAHGSPIPVTGNRPGSIAVGDFNGDRKPDLATANNASNNVTILLGDGSGGFTAASVSVLEQPAYIAVGDFNLDDKPDLAVTNGPFALGSITVLLGDGSGGFTGSVVRVGPFTVPHGIVVGDFDGDRKPDLATANFATGNATILRGDGRGGFTEASGSPIRVGQYAESIVADDFNNDGKYDLAVAAFGGNRVTSLLGDGTGSFRAPTSSIIPVGLFPRYIIAADFNLDGNLDLATANSSANNVSILLGDSSGRFTEASGSPVPVLGDDPRSIAVLDFNLDGKLDLAVAVNKSMNVTILLGDGSGRFTRGTPITVLSYPEFVVASDFNLDGKPDLATANGSDNLFILLGDGKGGLLGSASLPTTVGDHPFSLAVSDFNRDGKPDLAVANADSNSVNVLLGDGTGGFTRSSRVGTGTQPVSIATGDFNMDGKVDIVTVNFWALAGDQATILLGDGAGGFTRGSPITTGFNPRSVAVSDFNLDGIPDFVAASGQDWVSIHIGDGKGGFSQPPGSIVPVGDDPWSVAVGDFNRDGKPDFASVNMGGRGQLFDHVLIELNACSTETPTTINCPANITVNSDAGQCSASVTFAVTATGKPIPSVVCKVGATVVTSPHTFQVGTTTVNCTASNGVSPDATCSFTVTVQDKQPPTLTCPPDITAVTDPTVCLVDPPPPPCKTVTFPLPAVNDNCTGASVTCSPPSGSCFFVGTTSVTCTARDAAGNTASCNFLVTVFDVCLQDDSNPGRVLLLDTRTGIYRFCCEGVTYRGRGRVEKSVCTYQLEDDTPRHYLLASINRTSFTGTASLYSPRGTLKCSITDSDTRTNSCACQ